MTQVKSTKDLVASDVCVSRFQFGPNTYDARYVPAYGVTVNDAQGFGAAAALLAVRQEGG